MTRKKPFTPKEHFEAGAELAVIYDRMSDLLHKISRHYPLNTKQGRLAWAAHQKLMELRSAMDSAAISEDGTWGMGPIGQVCYYPPVPNKNGEYPDHYLELVEKAGAQVVTRPARDLW